jgi:hypothetical protein
MPTFDGATGRVYYKTWPVPGQRAAAIVFLHGFGEHSGLYHRLGNTLGRGLPSGWPVIRSARPPPRCPRPATPAGTRG